MKDQLSLAEIDAEIATKQEEIDALTNVRSSLVDALNALEGISNGEVTTEPVKRKTKTAKNGDGPDLFKSQSDDELAVDIERFLEGSDKASLTSLVKELAAGEYSDASKHRLHAVVKTMANVKVGRGGSLTLIEEENSNPPSDPDTISGGFTDPGDPDDSSSEYDDSTDPDLSDDDPI